AGLPQPLVVRLHAPIDPEVAFTSGTFVYYGLPISGFSRETTRAADIVYHELGHAVLYGFGIQPGGPRREAGARDEGPADQLAGRDHRRPDPRRVGVHRVPERHHAPGPAGAAVGLRSLRPGRVRRRTGDERVGQQHDPVLGPVEPAHGDRHGGGFAGAGSARL